MPMKIGIRLGWLRRLSELPKSRSAWATESSGPTTVTRSPSCNCRFPAATRSIPERLMRVMVTPLVERMRSSASVLPFSSGLVISIRREIIFLSGIIGPASTSRPSNATSASASLGAATSKIRSPQRSVVAASASSGASPGRQIRDTTKSRRAKRRIPEMLLPSTAGLQISTEIRRVVRSFSTSVPKPAASSSCRTSIRSR